jgi:acyl-CoA synthetase (NDP forming)
LVSPRNPLDVTPAAAEAAYDELVQTLLKAPGPDVVIVSCVPLAPALMTLSADLDSSSSFVALAKGWRDQSSKPLAMVFDGGPEYDELRRRVRDTGLPVFRSADQAARLIDRWIECARH